MARVETREGSSLRADRDGEEHLDEWFARRLESQGIPVRSGAAATARFLAVVGLAVALMAFVWAVSSVGPAPATQTGDTTATTTPGPDTTATGTTPTTGNDGGSGAGAPAVSWRDVTVDVLNGYGVQGAATTAAAEMETAGWLVGEVTNAGSDTQQTYVVFLPGFRAEARAVSKKLGLGAPVPSAEAGVSPSAANGVAVVLGPDGLPPLA